MADRRRMWSVAAWALALALSAGLFFWLGAIARRGLPTWPLADGALVELYTINATRGDQLLGAYSQYGWYHPGPFLFYALAPFYLLGGRSVYGLALGALAINGASLVVIGLSLVRRRDVTATFVVVASAGLLVYILRLPELITSASNLHVAVLPFAALLFATAAALRGDPWSLPLVAVLASLVTQTHIGFAPAAVAVGVIAIVVLIGTTWRNPEQRRRLAWWTLATVELLQIVWLPAIAEQLTGRPGNLARVGNFFFESAETQSMSAVLRSWSSLALAGGALSVIGLPIVAVSRWRDGHRVEGLLALLCLVASAISFASVLRIRGLIDDDQFFSLSVLGVMNLSLVAAGVLHAIVRWEPVSRLIPLLASIALVAGGVAYGTSDLMKVTREQPITIESAVVQRLFAQMRETLPSMGGRTTLFKIEPTQWAIGSGIILQMARQSMRFSVDRDLAERFDRNLAPTGAEDVLVTLCGIDLHRQLETRSGNVTIADSGPTRLYLDAISLIDHPEYR